MEGQKILSGFGGYLKYIWDKKRRIIFYGALFFPAFIAANYLQVYLPKIVIQELEEGRSMMHLIIVMAGLLVCMMLCTWLHVRMITGVTCDNRMVVQEMQNLFSEKLLYVDYKYLEDKQFISLRNMVRVNLFGGDIGETAENKRLLDFGEELIRLAAALGNAILYLLYLGKLSVWLGLIVIIIPLLTFILVKTVRKSEENTVQQSADVWQKLDYITRKSEDFGMAKDVRLYGMEDWLYSLSDRYCKERLHLKGREMLLRGLGNSANVLTHGIYYGFVLGCILYQFWKGNLGASDVVFYAGISRGLYQILDYSISSGFIRLAQISMEFNRFTEFLSYGEDTGKVEAKIQGGPAEIVLEHVSFSYPEGDRKILDDVSLTVRRGERIAIIGVNGAGKTTLMKLLCGLLHPTDGRILLNGTDIEEMTASERYAWFSCVFQDVQFLPLSIRENIAMLPAGEADDAKIWACLEQAGIREAVEELPQKLDTLMEKTLNEDAADFSGGQRQKLILARALYRDAGILILDEPTAALDALAEKEIYEAYAQFAAGKMSFFVSHRLAGTTFCDRILLLDGGCIAEEGTHQELIAAGGLYAEMFALQGKYYKETVHEMTEGRAWE